MNLTLEQILKLIGIAALIISSFYYIKHNISGIKADVLELKQIIFVRPGCLNLIDTVTCERNQDHIHTAIRRIDKSIEKFDEKLGGVDKKVDRLLVIVERAPAASKKNNDTS